MGLPHHSKDNFCWRCRANRGEQPWTDFRPTAAWRTTLRTAQELLEGPPSSHPLLEVPGVNRCTYMFDMMHICDQGVTLHCIGNVLFTITYYDIGGPKKEAFGRVWVGLQEILQDLQLNNAATS